MFVTLKHISPKTKILFVTILFLLLPSAFLIYLGLQSVREKAEYLRANYRGINALVRDKIEREILRLEEALATSLKGPAKKFQSAQELNSWLRGMEDRSTWLRHPFLINAEGAVISTSASVGWEKQTRSQELDRLTGTEDFQAAEKAEFVQKDYSGALRFYKNALGNVTTAAARAYVLSRIGRCYLKLGEYKEGINQYDKVLALSDKDPRLGSLPYSVLALSQMGEAYGLLNEKAQQVTTLLQLYDLLLSHPWDLESGEYLYYLKMTSEQIESYLKTTQLDSASALRYEELKDREKEVLEEIRFVDFVRQNLVSRIQLELGRGSISESQPQHVSDLLDNSLVQVGFLALPTSLQASGVLALAYQIDVDNVFSSLIPEVLPSVDLGRDIVVVILDEKERVQYSGEKISSSEYLVTESFSQIFPSWKVALFHRGGESIEQLVSKEKRVYLALFLGIIVLMAIGVFVTMRAASHELEVARLKAEFVSNVSHELKTPLALIRLFGETLETGIVVDESKRQEFYSIIRKESERLTHLINNVLDFSKMDEGTKEYVLEDVDIVAIVRSTLEAYKFHLRDLGFEFVTALPAEPIVTLVDKDAISQALLNLLANASKYSAERKYIRVEVSRNASSVLISVEDRGVGIAREDLPKIFDKFYRVRTGVSRNACGTGLGLTLIKHIAEAHHGTVEVQSELGKGTIFTMKLPLQLGR